MEAPRITKWKCVLKSPAEIKYAQSSAARRANVS